MSRGVLAHLRLLERSPQSQVPGSEGRQPSMGGGGREAADPAGEQSAGGHSHPQTPAALARGARYTLCIPEIGHFIAYNVTLQRTLLPVVWDALLF